MSQDPTCPAAEVRGLGLCGRHGFSEPEDRPHATEAQGTARVGLKVNAGQNQGDQDLDGPQQTIGCAGETLERVTAFTYLGSLITTTGGTDENAEARYRKAQAAFSVLRPIGRSKLIRFFDSNVKSVLLYGP